MTKNSSIFLTIFRSDLVNGRQMHRKVILALNDKAYILQNYFVSYFILN